MRTRMIIPHDLRKSFLPSTFPTVCPRAGCVEVEGIPLYTVPKFGNFHGCVAILPEGNLVSWVNHKMPNLRRLSLQTP